MLRRLYNLLFPFVLVLLLPGYLRRMFRRGDYRHDLGQRFGRYAPGVRARLAGGPPRPWLQAVSVGEMLVALKLIAALRARCPDLALILSTTTTTGFALAKSRVDARVEVVYTPIDGSGCVRRAFEVLRPSCVVIVDGGLWPNLLWEARQRSLPVALVNARLSPRSERRWRRFGFLGRPLMRLLDLVCVAEAGDIARWRNLGVASNRIVQTGSVKFDPESPAGPVQTPAADNGASSARRDLLRRLGVPEDAPVLLAGSTHPGEERILAEVYQRLRARFGGLFLIVAPRHVERAPDILSGLKPLGLQVFSRTGALPAAAFPGPPDVLLLDTTGELREWYAVATLVFIGKTLTARGGQNPTEAIAAGKPVVFGPHMDNFRDLTAQLLAGRAAVQVANAAALELACSRLLGDPAERARQTAAAAAVLALHAGAAVRTVEALLSRDGFAACEQG